MKRYATMKTDRNPSGAVTAILQILLSEHLADAVMVSARTPYSNLPMPMVFTDSRHLDCADPMAPVAPFNAARHAASLLRHETGKRLALVLRPCEIRALIELVKLKQCVINDHMIIGIECLGRLENELFLKYIEQDQNLTNTFYRDPNLQAQVTLSCRVCNHFQPETVDLALCTIGLELAEEIGLSAKTEKGEQALKHLSVEYDTEPPSRIEQITQLVNRCKQEREVLLKQTGEKINTIEKFQKYFANCLNCYNCRMACPVCYCKECVFMTDVFDHESEVLLRRAGKKDILKLPTETSMFHLTRMAHMSHSCVGCGQCSSVCPSDIQVACIFRKIAAEIQAFYDYEPGRDTNESLPFLVFEKNDT